MTNRPIPYYTLPCCYEERPDGTTQMVPQSQPTTPQGQPAFPQGQPMLPQGQPTQAITGGPQDFAPITPLTQPEPLTLTSTEYLNGFLRTQLGRRVRVEFLIGTGTLLDRTGTLVGVGANYINLRLIESDDVMTADFFSIKFITFLL
ncbi:hypothetical protein [Ruminiclostridium cellobioparum]|uniref:hypothetical protein n=1 Tax=Ruminiclostridium cellobioparum TaxID=29355 RepID=UPI0004897FE9|nr:hypothetical protein [Ruminiclostridium cellobioparum]